MPAKPPRTANPRTPRTTQSKLNFGPAANGTTSRTSASKKKPANGNILNFFKKVEVEETLFIEDNSKSGQLHTTPISNAKDEEVGDLDGTQKGHTPSRFSEDGGYPKRRKLSHGVMEDCAQSNGSVPPDGKEPDRVQKSLGQNKSKKPRKGPFLEDSDSEADSSQSSPTAQRPKGKTPDTSPVDHPLRLDAPSEPPKLLRDESCSVVSNIPVLKQEDSAYDDFKDLDEMEGLFNDDMLDDDVEDGEEFRYMRYMQEQARLEAEEAANYTSDGMKNGFSMDAGMTERCPLCDASLAGITPEQATVHVNACLDGNPVPLPARPKTEAVETCDASKMSKRFARAAVPRPGQANPIEIGSAEVRATSAFSKLMSGHLEDAAWASAAAADNASRGKPAYTRTCPFYKIMPGFYICVDAFRYGAVQGCNAYFLSHFHSDHYVGLSSSWCHGPIYCSKVTGSLVKQQLRTNAKWVVELEFEERVDIPGTEGVSVTMLPANHCPGSSLFLFEKRMGNGPNPRMHRILHCGDFRACPAQVTHPLLEPDIVDSISGKTRQQKIDVCYLDTTYLSPRYSFPPQEDVINACADFCKTISGDPNATDGVFDASKREKGSTSVSKFFIKDAAEGDAATKAEDVAEPKPKHRLLVICGTYSIGKERICKAIAQALNTKIFASAHKIRIIQQLGDPELSALLTTNPREAQVHMQMLMEIRAETLQEYLNLYKPHFSRIVGFRPSGWNFRNPSSTAKNVSANVSPSSVPTTQLLHGTAWRTRFGPRDFIAQRGSTREAMCFGVPYSEHSSFRELALFVMSLRIEKIVPTVNVGSEQSRKRMKGWLDRWVAERRRGGVVRLLEAEEVLKTEEGNVHVTNDGLWEGKDGRGGGVFW